MIFLLTSQAIFCKKYELAGTVVPEPKSDVKKRKVMKKRRHGRGRTRQCVDRKRAAVSAAAAVQTRRQPSQRASGYGERHNRPMGWDNGDW